MMQALLVLALMGQDVDVAVTGHGRRHGGEYELTVAGKGKGLRDQEIVSLKFRRLANRMNWEEGILVSAPAEDEVSQDTPRYVKGERVRHRSFGGGKIQGLTGTGKELKVTVLFDDEAIGEKKLVVAYAGLQREWESA